MAQRGNWRTIAGIALALFIAGTFFVLNTLGSIVPMGNVIAWAITIFSFMCIVASLLYGLVVQQINDITNVTKNIATKDDFKKFNEEILNIAKSVRDSDIISTKELLISANECGLEMVYKSRSKVATEIAEGLKRVKREVKALGVCISMPLAVPKFQEIVKEKTDDGVSFQFAYLQRETAEGEIDLYRQRSNDENYPAIIGDLKESTTRNIQMLEALRSNLDETSRSKLEIREYRAFPYISMIIIDDDMFVGSYLFGVNCPVIPMYKVVKKQDGIYDTYYNHFTKLWESAA